MKTSDVYKIEFKLILSFAFAIALALMTIVAIDFIKNIIRTIIGVYHNPMLDGIYQIYNFMYVLIFIIFFHLIFHKKIISFIEIDEKVKEISSGNFKASIEIKSDNMLGSLAKNINGITEKFNNEIARERRAEQTKIDLITSISHDLRTPLTAILGYLQLVDNDEYDNEFTLRSYVNIALNKTKRLKVLIDDLFELTMLDNYGAKLSKTKINIIELINQLAIEDKLDFRAANIECRLNLPEERIYVLGDSNKLARAFENLIFNCIKYSKTSEFMNIAVEKIKDNVNIEFINYGEQIPPMDIPYVFQRFYRVDKARSQDTGGSGLGLAITKNIIELHGGKIDVTSNAQKTVFKIMLPYC